MGLSELDESSLQLDEKLLRFMDRSNVAPYKHWPGNVKSYFQVIKVVCESSVTERKTISIFVFII